jgi:thiol-disulfide isomerase/thioredoxin
MHLRSLLTSFVTGIFCLVLAPILVHAVCPAAAQEGTTHFVDADGRGGSNPLTPKERLEQAVDTARSGKVEEAFDSACSCKNLQPHDPLFSVEYLNTLLAINGHADSQTRGMILNEAIRTIDAMKVTHEFNGQGNPEAAYHFMVSVGKLAEAAMPLSQPTGASLLMCHGSIARKLSLNSAFPADAKESLAEPLARMATSYAINQDQVSAVKAINEACELGYSDFEKLAADPHLKNLADQNAFVAELEKLESAYLERVQQWSEQAIDEFQPFRFEFNMDDAAGGSLANGDFDGKVLVVDFWATWCPPCREEIPHFVQLQNDYGPQDVQVIGISMDSPADPHSASKNVNKFLVDNDVNYPCGLGTTALKQRVPGDVKLPTTLFIDRSGTVRYMATGYHDYAKLSAITEAIANEALPVSTDAAH